MGGSGFDALTVVDPPAVPARPVSPLQINRSGTVDRIQTVLPASVPEWAVSLGLAILVVIVGWYLSKLAVRIAGRTVARRISRPSVTRALLRGIRIVVFLVSLLIAALLLGLGGVEILLSVTVMSAILGVVLAPLIGSFINGVFILSDQPFEIGDMIEIPDRGHRGFVEDITIRYTKIFTLENTFVVIPNSEIHRRDVINYSAEDERTRLTVSFVITYESDLAAAREAAARAARDVDVVLAGGPDIRIGSARYAAKPICDILEFGDHGVELQVRFWVKQPYKLTIAKSDVQDRIVERFADIDVTFAYPHRHHVFDETSGRASVSVMDSSSGTVETDRPDVD